MRRRENQAAFELLKGANSERNRYLRAVCCLQLEHLQEAEDCLLRPAGAPVPNGALHLLGVICQRTNRPEQAIEYFKRSLRADPLSFDSFTALCDLGVSDADSLLPPAAQIPLQHRPSSRPESVPAYSVPPTPAQPMSMTRPESAAPLSGTAPPPSGAPHSDLSSVASWRRPDFGSPVDPKGLSFESAPASGASVQPTKALNFDTPSVPDVTPVGHAPPSSAPPSSSAEQPPFSMPPPSSAQTPAVNPSGRLHFTSKETTQGKEAHGEKPSKLHKVNEASVEEDASARAEPKNQIASVASGHSSENSNNDALLLAVLGVVGRAYQMLTLHRGSQAVEALHRLPPRHFNTAWIQHLCGQAHFEMAQYDKARAALEAMQRHQPFRLRGLELLSTALWQLNRKVELCYLAQRVTSFAEGRASPEAWCVVGNCLSLQKEHEAALKVFQRAIQVGRGGNRMVENPPPSLFSHVRAVFTVERWTHPSPMRTRCAGTNSWQTRISTKPSRSSAARSRQAAGTTSRGTALGASTSARFVVLLRVACYKCYPRAALRMF